MSDFISSFQELVGGLTPSSSRESDLTLMQLEAPFAERLRRCAIPHTFDATILRVLEPEISPSETEETLREFESMPAVMRLADCLALHDVVRRELFLQWLEPAAHEEFALLSRRLAEHYRPRPNDDAVAAAGKEHSFLFHLLGSDLAGAFAEFQRVYDERREQARFNECEALVRLLREYESVLGAREAAWLSYYESEIASDSRDWPLALSRLEALVSRELPSDLKPRALLRLGSVLRRLKRFAEARARCDEALESAKSTPGQGNVIFRIHHELGIVARDEGNFAAARKELETAIAAAESNKLNLAIALNGLGTLLLKPSPQEAVASFEQALALMDRQRDAVRTAQILNNLALANANVGNWAESEKLYEESLSIKRTAADLYGQALTLLNMARIYQAQEKRQEARKSLLESANLFAGVHSTRNEAIAHGELARLARMSRAHAEIALHADRAIELLEKSGAAEEAELMRREFKEKTGRRRKIAIWSALAIVGFLILVILLVAIAEI